MDPSPLDLDLLYKCHLNDVFGYILGRVPSHAEAEDVTVEVFIAAAESLDRFRGECRPLTWLIAIARRKIAEATRQREVRQQWEVSEAELPEALRETLELLLVADIEQLPEDALLLRESREVMRRLLAGLPDAQREALLLQEDQGLSIREIARVIGRSEKAANSLLGRGRAAILRQGRAYFES